MTQHPSSTESIAHQIRRRVFIHTMRNNGGYLSQACSAAETLALLYNEVVNLGPAIAPEVPALFAGVPGASNPDSFTGAAYHGAKSPDYDRLFISPAHYALIIYTALIECGRMAEAGLEMFNKDGSSVEMIGAEHSPGFEVTTGSLAQCLSMASGVAWARKRRGDAGRVWVYLSDGELQEGQTWECFANMAFHGINNVSVVVDVNLQQCDGAMQSVGHSDPFAEKLRAFGATVNDVNGHDLNAMRKALAVRSDTGPVVTLMRTCPWQGMDYLKGRAPRLHYVRFTRPGEKDALQEAIAKQLGVSDQEIQQIYRHV